MGQTYTVEANITFKKYDHRPFCKIVQDRVINNLGKWPYGTDFTNPINCFKLLVGKDASIRYDCGSLSVCSDFDGSYSWEYFLVGTFEQMNDCFEDGSIIDIWPDNGHYTFTVSDGKICSSYEELG